MSNGRINRLSLELIFAGTLSSTLLFANPQMTRVTSPGREVTKASPDDELRRGVDAYRSGLYSQAAEHFQSALDLKPNFIFAKLYLATALCHAVIPGLETRENLARAQRAITLFQEILAENPHDINSMKQIAAILFEIGQLDEARNWQKRVLNTDPKDADASYTIGVIDWTESYRNLQQALKLTGSVDDGVGNLSIPEDVIAAYRTNDRANIEEALHYLNQAIVNRADYADAMAYLNLVYRLKATLDRPTNLNVRTIYLWRMNGH